MDTSSHPKPAEVSASHSKFEHTMLDPVNFEEFVLFNSRALYLKRRSSPRYNCFMFYLVATTSPRGLGQAMHPHPSTRLTFFSMKRASQKPYLIPGPMFWPYHYSKWERASKIWHRGVEGLNRGSHGEVYSVDGNTDTSGLVDNFRHLVADSKGWC